MISQSVPAAAWLTAVNPLSWRRCPEGYCKSGQSACQLLPGGIHSTELATLPEGYCKSGIEDALRVEMSQASFRRHSEAPRPSGAGEIAIAMPMHGDAGAYIDDVHVDRICK